MDASSAGRAPFFTVFVLTLAPWVIRNVVVADYTGFSSAGDEDLYFLCAAAVRGKLEHRSVLEEQEEMGYTQQRYFALHPEQRGWPRGNSVFSAMKP